MKFELLKNIPGWVGIKSFFLLSYRHAVISCLCATSEFSIFMLMLYYLKFNLTTSYIASFITATLIGFIGHSMFTFKIGRLHKRNALLFSIQASFALLLGYLIVLLLIHIGYQPAIAKVVQLISIFFFNVTFGKFFSFRKLPINI